MIINLIEFFSFKNKDLYICERLQIKSVINFANHYPNNYLVNTIAISYNNIPFFTFFFSINQAKNRPRDKLFLSNMTGHLR